MKPRPDQPNPDCSSGGFSLIELIGVLAILAILASVTTEALLSRMIAIRRQAEAAELSRLVDGMQQLVRMDHQLPAASDWPTALATGFASPVGTVGTDPHGNPRLWVPDPGWSLGGKGPAIAYRQSAYGTPKPEGLRMLLISGPPGIAVEAIGPGFVPWWDQSPGIPQNPSQPEGTVRADDVVVERIGFEPLFHRVILNNRSTELTARWAVDRIGEAGSCGPGRHHEAYYIETSRLLLLDSRGDLQETVLVDGASSWVFDAGRWHRRLGTVPDPGASGPARMVSDLAALPVLRGVAPIELADAMYDLMDAHVRWSSEGFRRVVGSVLMVPSHRRTTDAARRLIDVAAHFLEP